ncbi:hypothetical protein [Kitasatospora sp. NPDC057541]|uniref:hypothetical protein n=1 Tax=Kitasatospora sp. NPDC057541 TaxID=3346161 RepID=UPI0036CAC565
MTTSALTALQQHSDTPDETDPGGEDQVQCAAASAALQRAAGAGEEAAGWVRELAGRQGEEQALALERAADAIVRASGREIVPGSDGLLAEELRYSLAADVVLGASHTTGTRPNLHPGERMPLITVCAIAAALLACVATLRPSSPRSPAS